MTEPTEPLCPPDRRPHRDRVMDADKLLPEGKVAGICIDDTAEHIEWYLHELAKYPRLKVLSHGKLGPGLYIIKVRKEPSNN